MSMPDKGKNAESAAAEGNGAQRILEAAGRLFAGKGFENTTVRSIAAEARVNHALIYYHWGSKKNLLAAVLEKTQTQIRSVGALDADDARKMIPDMLRESLAGSGNVYLVTIARAFLDGMQPDELPGGFPGVEAVLAALEPADAHNGPRSDREVRKLVAVAVALTFGWVLVEGQVLQMVGLSSSDRDEARESLLRSIEGILRPVLPAEAAAQTFT